MNLHDMLIPMYRNMLRAVGGMIDKAAAMDEGDAMLAKRLAPDMLPLSSQLRFVANMPGEALARLTGREFRSHDEDPKDFAEAKTWVSEGLLLLDSVQTSDWRAANEAFDLDLPNGMTFHLNAEEYARDWVLPNFHFHTSMIYAIMRNNGVELGKADLIPHMGRYLKSAA